MDTLMLANQQRHSSALCRQWTPSRKPAKSNGESQYDLIIYFLKKGKLFIIIWWKHETDNCIVLNVEQEMPDNSKLSVIYLQYIYQGNELTQPPNLKSCIRLVTFQFISMPFRQALINFYFPPHSRLGFLALVW